ncbi:HECT-domain (ubiquitin-transferase), putative [Angomonas deanei]|uniref:HECT-domain (Ubiquitin-transferase), putative n=1 Tax=Angomonas deanei TaxID=59799 RepID=A0A7G2C6R5_9TRYP|nr:HECT-domain (ubiquitin-transferase), putative [Angomonas deanei]
MEEYELMTGDDDNLSLFDSLSQLCTMFAISDFGFIPFTTLSKKVIKALKTKKDDGDIFVMSVRALALFFEKFGTNTKQLQKHAAELETCLRSVFGVVVTPERLKRLKFNQCTASELPDELLKCLRLLEVRHIKEGLPTVDEQIAFCQVALDGSKWMCCKVIYHLTYLVRARSLSSVQCGVVGTIIVDQLSGLASLDLDADWDEQLRAVTGCLVTLQVWGSAEYHKKNGKDMRFTVAKAFLRMLNTVNSDSGSYPLLLACADVLVDENVFSLVSPGDIDRALLMLCTDLEKSSAAFLKFSDPFTANTGLANHQFDGDAIAALPNLQWNLAAPQWSSLSLLAKLLGGAPVTRSEYLWAWRGEDGEYYSYNKKQRERFTQCYRSATSEVKFKGGKRVLSIAHMTDTSVSHKQSTFVYFQPIPVQYTLTGEPLRTVDPRSVATFLCKLTKLTNVRRVLRTVSMGNTPVAQLATMISLHLLSLDAPSHTEETLSTLRSLITSQSGEQLERIANRLLQGNKKWAPVLREAGVADALTRLLKHPNTAPTDSHTRKRGRSASPIPRVSPVVQLIEHLEVAPPSPVALPRTTAARFSFEDASVTDLVEFLDRETDWQDSASSEALDALSTNTKKTIFLSITAYLLKKLQECSVSGRLQSLSSILEDENSFSVTVCSPSGNTSQTKDGGLRCKNGHRLKVHFSTNWECNVCKKNRSPFGSMACRLCNVDFCKQCVERAMGTIQVSVSASVSDLSNYLQNKSAPGQTEVGVLFNENGVLSNSCPISAVQQCNNVHYSRLSSNCKCGKRAPRCILALPASSGGRCYEKVIQHFSSTLKLESSVCYAVMDAVSSCGPLLFQRGVAGLPAVVRNILTLISPLLPTTFNVSVLRFLAIGCRRFALQSIHEGGTVFRGTVQGEIQTNGLSSKIVTSRTIDANTIGKLYEHFCGKLPQRNKVEVGFHGEEGTGTGPTQEFYTEVSRYFSTHKEIWYKTDDGVVLGFPTNSGKYEKEFFTLGAILGRAFIDHYFTSVELSPLFWEAVLLHSPRREETNEEMSPALALFTKLQPIAAKSMSVILSSTDSELEEMGMYDEEGNVLQHHNAASFVNAQVQKSLEHALENVFYFSLGLSQSLELPALQLFTVDNLCRMFGGAGSDDGDAPLFTETELRQVVTEAHGYAAGSKEVATFVSIVGGEFGRLEQKYFLEFVTGCDRLPLNGLQGLERKITVVRKEMEDKNEGTLPSCNTCFLYVKLPPYSSRKIMKERLLFAITEGRKHFSLS